MSIVKTRKITVYSPGSEISAVMDYLQRSEAFEPTGKSEEPASAQALARLEENISDLNEAIEILNRLVPQKKSIFARRRRSPSDPFVTDRVEVRKANHTARAIIKCSEQIKHNISESEKITAKITQLSPYLNHDLPLGRFSTAYTEHVSGGCTVTGTELSALAQDFPIYYEEFGKDGSLTLIWAVYLKTDSDKAEEFLAEAGFSESSPTSAHLSPRDEINHLEDKKNSLLAENDSLRETLTELSKKLQLLELYHDKLSIKADKYRALAESQNTETVFAITGYVPDYLAAKMMSSLENRFTAAAEYEELDEGEETPVAFSNNAFSAPVEEITASYSMPSKHDIDPNPIMAFFYYWFFGMMFSDAGYGLLMMIACGILGFSQILEADKRRMFKMFFYCGISTTIWGILYGSFFGDLIGTVSSTFFSGAVRFRPLLIDPVNQALELLIISVAFGMLHILTALSVKFYILWRDGNKKDAIFDVGFWMVVLVGISILAAGMSFGSDTVQKIGGISAVLGAVGLVLTGGRDKHSPIAKFFSGIMSLYDITGYVGDILSYSRLMALGLATGVIASVVNVLASLGGKSVVGVIVFVLISIVGHSINFAINMLGAYVHTNRLQYVEFYQKFYEGGGRRFRPLKTETKYYDFSEN
ncbi:MAG: V-type ATP synthase subunit I [Clostridiales bacterium]|nr:V-type ATP synthase subunit I [Clostridiales bacterium]